MPKIVAYVDDSRDDLFLFQSACNMARVKLQPLLIEGGIEAMHFLAREGQYADKKKFPDPTLVLLDLKMPAVDGFDVLRQLRADPKYGNRPVALLSSSYLPEDIQRAKELGATWYFVKPTDIHGLMDFVLLLDDCLIDPKGCTGGIGRVSKFK